MQTRMLTRKITMDLHDGQDPFVFFMYEKEDNLVTDEGLKTLGRILKKLDIPAKEIIVLARQAAGNDTYKLFLQCDNYVSIHNKAQVNIAEKMTRTVAALSNTIMNLRRSVPMPTPELTIKIELVTEKKAILEVDPTLVKNIFATKAISAVTFIPTRPVGYVEALGPQRTLSTDEVIKSLRDAPGYDEITKKFLLLEVLDENRLARLSYYVPLLAKLMGVDNNETKYLIQDKVDEVIKVFTSHAAVLKNYLNDAELNREANGLPDNNVWSVYKRTIITPRMKELNELKAKFTLNNDLQTLFDVLDVRIKTNSKQAVLDSELIQRVKSNFIRSMQVTALTYWCELQKNTTLDRRVLEDYLASFNADLVETVTADNKRVQNIAFSSNYALNSFSEIAEHINSLKASALRGNLLDMFEKECKAEKCFTMERSSNTTVFKWTPNVTDANNPQLLQKEEENVEALFNKFYADGNQKVNDATTSAKEILKPIKEEVSRIRSVLPQVKDLYEQLKIQVKKADDQIAEYNVALPKQHKLVDDQQKKAESHYLAITKPSALWIELRSIAAKAVSGKKTLDGLLARIGAATTAKEADSAHNAAAPELTALQTYKSGFDAKEAEITAAVNEGNRQMHTKSIDDLMRENLLRLRVALFDVDFLNENTTEFLCMGGTTVSLPDGEAVKVPRGAAEMISEMLKCCDNNTDLSTLSIETVINTLTAVKLLAQNALNRSDSRLFMKVRKDPIQLFYQQVASLNLSIGFYKNLESSQFTAIDLSGVNSNWPVKFTNKAYELDRYTSAAYQRSKISSVTRPPLEESLSLSGHNEVSVSSRRVRV